MPVRAPGLHLRLMLGFELTWAGLAVVLPRSAQRLMAFLALHDRPVLRSHVAETLWLDSPDSRSSGSLRTALWRLGRSGHNLVQVRGQSMCVSSDLTVDTRQLADLARSVRRDNHVLDGEELEDLAAGGELLPGWYDDWVLMERERTRQLRLQTLVAAAEQLIGCGRHAEAVVVGLAALENEPLHERAHGAIIRAHMAGGNRGEALRQYQRYVEVLTRELRIEPSADMQSLAMALRHDLMESPLTSW